MSHSHSARIKRLPAAFTLIEVLVVVAIMALLVAILLPSLAKARRQARRAVCASQLHQIGIAMLTYRETHRNFPHQAMINIDPSGKGEAIGLWTVSTHRVIGRFLQTGFKGGGSPGDYRSGAVFYCPNVRESDRHGDLLGAGAVGPVGDEDEAWLHTTYMYLARLNDARNDPAQCNSSYNADPPGCDPRTDIPRNRRFYVTRDPDSQRVLMGDMTMFWGGGNRWRLNHGPWWQPYIEGQRPNFEGINLGFGDGHVEWRPSHRFPREMIEGASMADLLRTAVLVRDRSVGDFFWW